LLAEVLAPALAEVLEAIFLRDSKELQRGGEPDAKGAIWGK
jgi:hypothetical protein